MFLHVDYGNIVETAAVHPVTNNNTVQNFKI